MKETLFIAHRGYSQFEKENTLVAFSAAGAIKEFYGIETDVHVTTDNHYITIHDDNVYRVTSDTVDLNVRNNTFETVRSVKLADVDGSLNRVDLRVPELCEYLRVCKKYNKVAIIELKHDYSKTQLEEIVSIVKNEEMLNLSVFISFHLNNLIILREILPTQPAQWLLCEFKEEHMETLLKYNLDVDAHYRSIDKDKIDLCHKNNIKVNIWTVNEQEVADKYIEMGVDFITTNWIYKTTK